MATITVDTHTIIDKLRQHGVKPSAQRIEIMRYIMEHETHPTVDEIFHALLESQPTLSRTTVYNTVWLLANSGAIKTINIDRSNSRFDYIKYPHAHFRCKLCSQIFDLPFDYSNIAKPDGFKIDSVDVYFEGICMECMQNGD